MGMTRNEKSIQKASLVSFIPRLVKVHGRWRVMNSTLTAMLILVPHRGFAISEFAKIVRAFVKPFFAR